MSTNRKDNASNNRSGNTKRNTTGNISNHRNAKRAKERKRRKKIRAVFLSIVAAILAFLVITIGNWIYSIFAVEPIDYSVYWSKEEEDIKAEMPLIDVQLLDSNEYSRPGIAAERIRNVVVHYTANPGTTAQQNRDYFNGLQDTRITKSSSNFVIGIDGEIIQCVPTTEVAYASNQANIYSVSIEVCHPDETGKFTDASYKSLVELTAYLCDKFDLKSEDVIRHYDVTGKLCPLYFVENEDAYEQFHADVASKLK